MNPYMKGRTAYKKAAVNTNDQGTLILMLYDGTIRFLKSGIRKLEENDLEGAHISIGKAKAIISELRTSLDTDKGGEVAKNLERLYLYMFNRLIDANVKKDADSLREVLSLVSELREGWSTVTNKGQKKTAPVGIAPRGNYGAAGGVKKPLKIRG